MDSSEPQLLTKEQIEYLVSALPPIHAADENNRFLITEGVKATLRELLKDQKLAPEMIERFKEILVFRHYDSFNTPGTSIGIDGSSGIGALIMQLTLNTFHLSGAASTASGLDSLRDLIMARTSRTGGDTCTVVFSNPHTTFEEALASRQYLVGSTVKDFVKSYEIERADKLAPYWWSGTEVLEFRYEREFNPQNYVLRLHLNLMGMRKHKVTSGEIERVLIKQSSLISASSTSAVKLVGFINAGPISDAIIDIHIGNKEDEAFPDDPQRRKVHQISFLENVFYAMLGEIQVKGIKGVLEIYPQIVDVLKYVRKVRPLGKIPPSKVKFINDDKNAFFSLVLDPKLNLKTGISIGNLEYLFKLLKCQFLKNRGSPVVVMPAETQKSDGSYPDPLAYARQQATLEEERYEKELQAEQLKQAEQILELEQFYSTLKEGKEKQQWEKKLALASKTSAVLLRSPLTQAMEYVYLLTHNAVVSSPKVHLVLKRLLTFPFVDPRFTYSNNMHTMAEVLGIESAFNMVTQELQNVITSSGVYVHPSVIIMVAEFIMSRGVPYGATFSGISRHPGGHLANATLERAGSVFSKAAALGAAESIDNVSSSIVVASRIRIGTGLCDVGFQYTENGVTKKAINEEIYKINSIDSKSAFLLSEEKQNDLDDLQELLKDKVLDFDFDNTEDEDTNTFISTLSTGQTMDKKQTIVLQRFAQPLAPKITFDPDILAEDFDLKISAIKDGKISNAAKPQTFAPVEAEPTEMELPIKSSRTSSRSSKSSRTSSSSKTSSPAIIPSSAPRRKARITLEPEDELEALAAGVKVFGTKGL